MPLRAPPIFARQIVPGGRKLDSLGPTNWECVCAGASPGSSGFSGARTFAASLHGTTISVFATRKPVRPSSSCPRGLSIDSTTLARGYPPAHFEIILAELEPTLQFIIVRVLSLLTRLTANGTSSGHTPPTLSPLFGPLLFGLGPATLAFHHAYMHYLRSANATEHLLLAFIRWQDTPRLGASSAMYPSGSSAALGVPIRLREWIKGYPAMLTFVNEKKNVKPQPRKGAKTVVLSTVRRNVRSYSPDLVKTAATWASRAKTNSGITNGFTASKEWERIAPQTLRLSPRYSETFKKRMNMSSNFHPETPLGMSYTNSTTSSSQAPPLASTLKIGISQSSSASDYLGLGKGDGNDRFRSLTDLKWGEFEAMGFGSTGDEKKLQFDLTESARQVCAL